MREQILLCILEGTRVSQYDRLSMQHEASPCDERTKHTFALDYSTDKLLPSHFYSQTNQGRPGTVVAVNRNAGSDEGRLYPPSDCGASFERRNPSALRICGAVWRRWH